MSEKIFDGNAEQVRVITEQLAEAIIRKINNDDEASTRLAFHQHPDFQAWLDRRISEKIRLWVFGAVAANIIPMLAIVFMLGTIKENVSSALSEQTENTQTLYARGQFIRDQQDFNCAIRTAIKGVHNIDIGNCRFASTDSPRDTRR